MKQSHNPTVHIRRADLSWADAHQQKSTKNIYHVDNINIGSGLHFFASTAPIDNFKDTLEQRGKGSAVAYKIIVSYDC